MVATGSMGIKISTVLLFVSLLARLSVNLTLRAEHITEVRPLGRGLLRRTEGHTVTGEQYGSTGATPQWPDHYRYSVTAYSICSVNPENLLCFLGRKNKLF